MSAGYIPMVYTGWGENNNQQGSPPPDRQKGQISVWKSEFLQGTFETLLFYIGKEVFLLEH